MPVIFPDPAVRLRQHVQLSGAVAAEPEVDAFVARELVGAFSSLRWGELAELRRRDVDLETGRDRVSRKLAIIVGRVEVGPPKSESGVRVVALPTVAVEALRKHMGPDGYVPDGPDALIFIGAKGKHLGASTFGPAVKWRATVVQVALREGFHFHDLRHTGNTLAASSGASTRELMTRMGHSTVRATLIYQHATSERGREIADGMNQRIVKPTAGDAGRTAQEPAEDESGTGGTA